MTKNTNWSCISNCGACCKLSPEERQEAISVLSPQNRKLYLSLVAEDGWCRFYNKKNRNCTIYDERPIFCNVGNISSIFGISENNTDSFAISCCKDHIRHKYGPRSRVMKRFVRTITTQTKS